MTTKGQRTKTDLDLLDYDGALIISKLRFKILGKHSSITSEAENVTRETEIMTITKRSSNVPGKSKDENLL